MKKFLAAVLSIITVLSFVCIASSAAGSSEPYVSLVTNPPTAVAGEYFSHNLFRFCDNGYTHKVSYKLFVDDGTYADLDNYNSSTGTRTPSIVQEQNKNSITVNGLTFDSNGVISGTPVINNKGEQQCVHFNAYITWYYGGRKVRSQNYNIEYDFGDGMEEYSDWMKFRLYIVKPQSKAVIGNSPKEIGYGDEILIKKTVKNNWYKFTAYSSCCEIEKYMYISKVISGSKSESGWIGETYEYYPYSIEIYNEKGIPVCDYVEPIGGGGDVYHTSYYAVDVIPGETYYIKVSCDTKFGFWLRNASQNNGIELNDSIELKSKVSKVDFVSTETGLDPRTDDRFGDIPDSFTHNTVWNVYRVEADKFYWSSEYPYFEYGCQSAYWDIPLINESEESYLVSFSSNTEGNNSADFECGCSYYDSIHVIDYVLCSEEVNITSKFVVDIYVPADKMVVAENGSLKIVKSTGKVIRNNPMNKSASYGYRSNVTFTAEVPEGDSVEWLLDGQKQAETGSMFTVMNAKESYTVKAIVTDANGRIITDEETIDINNSFWAKVVWFFVHLFVPERYEIIQ